MPLLYLFLFDMIICTPLLSPRFNTKIKSTVNALRYVAVMHLAMHREIDDGSKLELTGDHRGF